MPTLQIPAIDVKWFVAAATGTTYADYPTALAAAVALSVANTNAAVHVSEVYAQFTAVGGTGQAQCDLLPGPLGTWMVGLATQTEYYPLATAIAQAYTTSAANSNAEYYVGRVFQVVTAP